VGPPLANLANPKLKALRARREEVTARASGTSYSWMEWIGSPSLLRTLSAAWPSADSTCCLSGASVCSLAKEMPVVQLTALRAIP
jgi:hypothetical protein